MVLDCHQGRRQSAAPTEHQVNTKSVKNAILNQLNYLPRNAFVVLHTDGYWLNLGSFGTFFLGASGTERPAALMALQSPCGGSLMSM